jgi:hypothetical protein
MAAIVPIEIELPKEYFNTILVDDDSQSVWKMVADYKKKSFVGFYNFDEFLKQASKFDLTSPLFIDSNLSNGVKGEVVSKTAFDLGFKNIYLCTGYDPSQFQALPHIKAIIGKDPVF